MHEETEAETRRTRVDVQLARAGWTKASRRVIDEFFLAGDIAVRAEGDLPERRGFADSALLIPDGRPVGVVEVKRFSRDPLEGETQASGYADRVKRRYGIDPFIFLTNGDQIWFWHRSLYPPRQVSGFFTPEDLERLAFIDRFNEPPSQGLVNNSIVDRGYQIEAVKTVAERIELGYRKFLLVLATGTGKTRVAIAAVDLLRQQNWVQRVLFLADRRELVKQARGAFKEHLPDEHRAWIDSGEIDDAASIHLATYPGMMGLYKRLSPGYYDLIVCDESHRSVYNRYRGILEHFDAIHLGLTATPVDFIDRNTFALFDCESGLPTIEYGYDEAVRERYLLPYRPVHVARTGFQVDGMARGELPDEVRQQVQAQGIDPDEFSFDGSDLEKTVSNTGTNESIVREFIEHSIKDKTGTIPAKSIIFAISHRHALALYKAFNRLYPHLQRRGCARVIDSQMERADTLLDDFKHKDMPRVAISVDMLDTGIDVPAIRNLVFAKPVFSKVKFWQMIGRGTRKWTDPDTGAEKADFLIIDHWDSFEYFQINKDGREPAVSVPLPTRLFRLRLQKLEILLGRGLAAEAEATRGKLVEMIQAIPLDTIEVTPFADEIRKLIEQPNAWSAADQNLVQQLSQQIAPLLRYADVGPWAELQFENLTEQLALAHLRADEAETVKLQARVVQDLERLPTDLAEVRQHREALTFALTGGFWQHLDYPRIMDLQETFAPLMRHCARRQARGLVQISTTDKVRQRRWLVYGPGGEGTFAETYRRQVEALVKRLAEQNPALRRLRSGDDVDDADLEAIAATLSGPDLFITASRLREAYEQPQASFADFLRHILGQTKLPDREALIVDAFDRWIRQHPGLGATQLLFLRTLRHALIQRAEVTTLERLREPPFSSIGDPEALFEPDDLTELIDLVTELAA
ncbi:MAG: DEAD/DEAH box helicase family protein [Gammaproteobacteria bacterium]|jgi:type I restriction enzyme R subunit|nr:DEAD/DEAH box helicase family protein [Gammaproteobacteria bacterium]